ncbi:hypothetical protein [Legionella sp. WA2022007384]
MQNQQLRAIYINPSEILSEPTLLEQIQELAEIGFNKEFEEDIKSKADKIELYMSPTEYTEGYLDFLNSMLSALSLAKEDINTDIIRQVRAKNEHSARTNPLYKSIKSVEKNETLKSNVSERLDAFIKKLGVIRNQQLILQAKSLVKSANDDFVDSQASLISKQKSYVQLIANSKYSLESLTKFDQELQLWFVEKFSSIAEKLDEKKRIIDKALKVCEANPVDAEAIKKEQTELAKQRESFEASKKQAEDLMSLMAQLKQIKNIESQVAKSAEELLIPSDAIKLQEFLKFITAQEEEIKRVKQKINGTSEIHTKTLQAIGVIEQSIQERKKQAENELEAIRNQKLLLQAKSLVILATEDLAKNNGNLESIQKRYFELLIKADYSPEAFEEFEQNFEIYFGAQSILTWKQSFDKKKRSMDEILKECEASPEEIRKEQNELNGLISKFESILKEAEQLKNLKALFEQIKSIEAAVKKQEDQLKPEDVDSLQAFIQFTSAKLEEIKEHKQGFKGEIPLQTAKTIQEIEKSIQKKKENAESDLQKIKHARIEVQQEVREEVSKVPENGSSVEEREKKDPGSNGEGEKVNNEVALAEEKKERLKNRLREAISLITKYKEILDGEQKKCSITLFHQSRNQAKLEYCKLLEIKLGSKVDTITSESNISQIINEVHDSIIKDSKNKIAKKEITKGGSYFGTSRMLSLQRLLDINDAWGKGHSKLFGISIRDDFHGLKSSGVVEKERATVKQFYLGGIGSDEKFHELRDKAFPPEASNKKQSYT